MALGPGVSYLRGVTLGEVHYKSRYRRGEIVCRPGEFDPRRTASLILSSTRTHMTEFLRSTRLLAICTDSCRGVIAETVAAHRESLDCCPICFLFSG